MGRRRRRRRRRPSCSCWTSRSRASRAVDQSPRTCESKGPRPAQPTAFAANNPEVTKISGQKDAYSDVASDDTMELFFCRPTSLLLRNKILQLLSLELQKII